MFHSKGEGGVSQDMEISIHFCTSPSPSVSLTCRVFQCNTSLATITITIFDKTFLLFIFKNC